MQALGLRKLTHSAIFVFLATITFYFAGISLAQAAEPVLKVQPQSAAITTTGGETTVSIEVGNVSNLYGADFKLKFDPTVLQVKDMLPDSPGIQIEAGAVFAAGQTLPIANKIDNSAGTVHFAQIFLGEANGFTGTGTLAKITFVAKKEGSTSLELMEADLVSADAQAIMADMKSGALVVGNGGTPSAPPDKVTNPQPSPNPNPNPSPQPMPGQPTPSVNFKDMGNHWAKVKVAALASKGIINGYLDGTFRPEDKVTRAEFIKMVTAALGLKGVPTALNFADAGQVPNWAKDEFSIAVAKGFIKGDTLNRLNPIKTIKRAEMAAIIVRALGLENQAQVFTGQLTFTDAAEITWAKGYVGIANNRQIINGFPDQTFRPEAFATRAQAAVMISQLLQTK